MKWAYYELSVNPPSFDFVQFMQYALAAGAGGVVFKRGKHGHHSGSNEKAFGDSDEERLNTIILPLVERYGVEHKFVDAPDGEYCYPPDLQTSHSHDLTIAKLPPKPFPVMPSQAALDRANDRFKGKRPIVMSLRRMARQFHHGRNSGPDWEKWGADHDVFLIPDYDQEKVSIDDRAAYCELASLNMGVNSGVAIIPMLSLRPFLIMKMVNTEYKVTSPWHFQRIGFPVGSQMPWSDKSQKIVWNSSDDYATIESEFQTYMSERG